MPSLSTVPTGTSTTPRMATTSTATTCDPGKVARAAKAGRPKLTRTGTDVEAHNAAILAAVPAVPNLDEVEVHTDGVSCEDVANAEAITAVLDDPAIGDDLKVGIRAQLAALAGEVRDARYLVDLQAVMDDPHLSAKEKAARVGAGIEPAWCDGGCRADDGTSARLHQHEVGRVATRTDGGKVVVVVERDDFRTAGRAVVLLSAFPEPAALDPDDVDELIDLLGRAQAIADRDRFEVAS